MKSRLSYVDETQLGFAQGLLGQHWKSRTISQRYRPQEHGSKMQVATEICARSHFFIVTSAAVRLLLKMSMRLNSASPVETTIPEHGNGASSEETQIKAQSFCLRIADTDRRAVSRRSLLQNNDFGSFVEGACD